MSDESKFTSRLYRIELLKGNNWMPWKRRMLAVLWYLGLETHIEESSKLPVAADPSKLTKDETEAIKKWTDGDAKTRTRIELAVGDSEMIHLVGTQTAREMWKQLTLVKESCRKFGVLAM
jgi:uncharacterized protein YaeQ